jgi:hypothetical protein
MKIITLEGQALRDLFAELFAELDPAAFSELEGDAAIELDTEALARALVDAVTVHTLRVARDGDAVKFKVNEGVWSPPYRAADEDLRRDILDHARQAPRLGLNPEER